MVNCLYTALKVALQSGISSMTWLCRWDVAA
jgi:hypothetical protein